MSDLEQSDIENMSDDESSVDENKQSSKPTFPQVNTKTDNINSKVDTKKATKTDDVDEVGEYSEEEDADDDADADAEVVEESEVETDNDENESAGNSDNDDISVDEKSSITSKKKTSNVKKSSRQIEALPVVKLNIPDVFEKNESDYESDADEEQEDDYLQKFDRELRENYILEQHPESISHNYDEIYNLAKVQRNKDNIIVDDLHKTIPMLTKYEKTRILGQRAKQINNGAKPHIPITPNMIDGYLIALKELEEKKIPVIIRRPLPNGASEYWHLKDLEILA
jgi:DNA-directed RNA polymerase I, II, and III subunit RPABC2